MTDPATINVIKETLPESPVYDGMFTIKKQRWGTYVSLDLDGKGIITSLDEEGCIRATRWYLKAKQDGFEDDGTAYDGTVGGKL
jgi:hypothetical protein